MGTAAKPEKILKELAKLWVDLAKQEDGKGAGVIRACAMTLIAAVEEEAEAQAAGETIAELMHQHPSRVIVMRVTGEAGNDLDARVFAQCWMPFGRRQQICCEEIEITASKARVDDLPNLVLGLMAPDLPVVLWCRSERLCRDQCFGNLFPLTDKLILDSAAFADSESALEFIRGLTAAGRNVGDLSWTRLTPLRSMIAQMFENEPAKTHLPDLRQVTISYAGPGEAASTCLWYLSSWFRTALGIPVELQRLGEGAHYQIQGIQLVGPGFQAAVRITGSTAEIQVGALTRQMSFPKRNDYELLREELSIIGADPVYRRCME